jgi:hypothetical protein
MILRNFLICQAFFEIISDKAKTFEKLSIKYYKEKQDISFFLGSRRKSYTGTEVKGAKLKRAAQPIY